MKIIFTGKTDFKYNRVLVLLEGLKQIDEVNVEIFPIEKHSNFDKKRFAELQEEADFIYIPPFRHRDVNFIKKLTNKPIVFDPLISKYLTKVVDYGHFWKAPFKYFPDKIAFSKADFLIADTVAHKNYFSKKFGVTPTKIGVVPVGVDTSKFYPTNKVKNDEIFKVGFYGTFVPLQGVLKIVQAAQILKDQINIQFHILGQGYDYKKVAEFLSKHNLKQVKLLGWIGYDELNEAINTFDICLGVFGDSIKADAVVPNKAFHYAALGKCIISKNTPGIKEVFTDNENIVLCENTPEKIAKCILKLKQNKELTAAIGGNAKEHICKEFNHIEIAKKFIGFLKKCKN